MILFMVLMVFVFIFIIAAGVILTKLKAMEGNNNSDEDIPVKMRRLLSEAELNFYHVLKSILPDGREISCKCRLEDIMYVENCPKRESYRGKIKSRHVDFVIYNSVNGFIDCAIELDDKSHSESEKQMKSDRLKDQVFQKIGIPLIRIKVKRFYRPEEIIKIIEEKTKI